MNTFKIGDLVVCSDNNTWPRAYVNQLCEIIFIEHEIKVKALSSDLVKYRKNLKFSLEFYGKSFSKYYNLSSKNKLLNLVL